MKIRCLLHGHEWHGLYQPQHTCAKCGKQRPNPHHPHNQENNHHA